MLAGPSAVHLVVASSEYHNMNPSFSFSSSNNNALVQSSNALSKRVGRVSSQVMRHPWSLDGALVSVSLREYARVVANPFTSPPTGIPVGAHAGQTAVFRSIVTGELATESASGQGGIGVTPYFANDLNGIFTTSLTSTAGGIPWAAATGITSRTVHPYAPYTMSQLGIKTGPTAGNSIQARLVACSLRIRNTTPDLRRGGRLIMGQSVGQPIGGLTTSTVSGLLAAGQAVAIEVDNLWHEFRLNPLNVEDYAFNENWQGLVASALPWTFGGSRPLLSGGTAAGVGDFSPALFMIASAPTVDGSLQAQTYEYELAIVVEYIGIVTTGVIPGSVGGSIPSDRITDITPLQKVRTIISRVTSHHVPREDDENDPWWRRVADSVWNSGKSFFSSAPVKAIGNTALEIVKDAALMGAAALTRNPQVIQGAAATVVPRLMSTAGHQTKQLLLPSTTEVVEIKRRRNRK